MRNALFILPVCFFLLLYGCLFFPSSPPPANATALNASSPSGSQIPSGIEDRTAPAGNDSNNATIPPAPPSGPQAQSNATPTASVFNSSFSPTQGSGWSSKNALKISMLKSGERLVFSNWQLRLSGLTQTGLPSAQFDALDPFGASLVSFSVPNNQAVELVLPDGSRFIVAAVFAVGEGSKASVQAQVYEAKDLSKSNLSIQVSEPQNGFTVEQMFPAPPKIQSGSLAIGDRMDAGAFRLLLIGLDPSLKPPGAQYGLEDSGGLPIDRFNLGLGQMVVLHMSDDTRYAVVFRGLSTVPDLAAQTDIYKITVFLKNNSSSAS